MEHHCVRGAVVMLSDLDIPPNMFRHNWVNGAWVRSFLTVSPAVQRRERILNFGFNISQEDRLDPEGMQSLRVILKAVKAGDVPDDFQMHLANIITDLDDITRVAYRQLTGQNANTAFAVKCWGEPAPNPNSRVTLSPERDRLGKNRVRLDWRLSDIDLFTMKRAQQILAEEFGRVGFGRLKIMPIESEGSWPSPPFGSWHHIGTTRMHTDPKKGVVDSNCRVHGVANLFVAGSSVFPTAGHANPTLTIVALSIRLADHVKNTLVYS
jgi:choline dehydrogenase-like flavoprotein